MPSAEPPIRTLREYFDFTGRKQIWAARQLGISATHLSDILAGHRQPSRELAERIAALTGLPIHRILRSEVA